MNVKMRGILALRSGAPVGPHGNHYLRSGTSFVPGPLAPPCTVIIAVDLSVQGKRSHKMVTVYFIACLTNPRSLCSPLFVPSHRHGSIVAIEEALDACIFGKFFNVVHRGSVPAFQQQANVTSELHSGECHVQALPTDSCETIRMLRQREYDLRNRPPLTEWMRWTEL